MKNLASKSLLVICIALAVLLFKECEANKNNNCSYEEPTGLITQVEAELKEETFKNKEMLKNNVLLQVLNNDLDNHLACIIFFISPRKFNRSVKDIKEYFLDRKILICREMTKFYEEFIRADVDKLEAFKSDPKGELTIVISEKTKERNSSIILKESDKKNIQKMIKKLSIKDITDLISQNSNVPKKEIYSYCLKLKNEK